MSNFNIGLQKAKGGYKVVLYSDNNGKLVLSGEVIPKKQDAVNTLKSIKDAWNDERDTLMLCAMVIPSSHKWPKNAGPKKKAAKKVAVRASLGKRIVAQGLGTYQLLPAPGPGKAAKKAKKAAKPIKLGPSSGLPHLPFGVTSKKAKKK